MLLSWARAEAPGRWRGSSPPHLAKLEAGGEVDARERAEIIAFLRRVRGDVDLLIHGRSTWYEAEILVAAFGGLLVDPYWVWLSLGVGRNGPCPVWRAPHPRTVADLAAHPDAPPLTLDGPFSFERMRGAPICIGTRLDGPLRLIEGSNRARAIWQEHRRGRRIPETVSILVGIHPEPDAFRSGTLCLALASVGWTRDGKTPVRLVRSDDPSRPHLLACPATRRSSPVSNATFDGLLAAGFREGPVASARG